MQSTIDKQGRVEIPKSLREDLHLGPGTALTIEERDGAVILLPQPKSASSTKPAMLKEKSGVLVFAGEAQHSLTAAVDRHRQDRLRTLSDESSD